MANEVPYEDEGTDYLDDVAKYLHNSDLSSLEGKQNVTVYTIGFTVNSPLLERTAQNGGGKYYYCHNAQAFGWPCTISSTTSSKNRAPSWPGGADQPDGEHERR